MKIFNRKEFIQKIGLLAGSTLLFPKLLFAGPKMPAQQQFGIIDLHCHPSLKMYMWDKKMWKRHWGRSKGENFFNQQEDVHGFNSGNVRGVVASHYLTEAGIESRWYLVKFLWPAIKALWFSEATKIEHQDYSNFAQINMMMDILENQLSVCNQKKKTNYIVARNYDEFERAVFDPTAIPFIHAIEGAHALGRNFVRSPEKIKEKQEELHKNPPAIPPVNIAKVSVLSGEGQMMPDPSKPSDKYIRNLDALFARGVCMLTLSHFFENDLSWPCEGISPKSKDFPGFKWEYTPSDDNRDLEIVGVDVVKHMLEIGMVVDLTHMTPKGRAHVFRIRDNVNQGRLTLNKHPRPLIFSHVGSQEVFDRHDHEMYPNYGFYDVNADEIREISQSGGLMGVIPEIFWLAGSNRAPQIPGKEVSDESDGIQYMIETMKALNNYTITKDYDNIGIGTDFDGLADNPKDIYLDNHLDRLVTAMKNDPELNQKDRIEKILWGNALRVLKFGWGEATIPRTEWPKTTI